MTIVIHLVPLGYELENDFNKVDDYHNFIIIISK